MSVIIKRLIKFSSPVAYDRTVSDIRLGLGYSCIELDNGACGIAWTPSTRSAASCTHLSEAGTIIGRPAAEILDWLNSDIPLKRTCGLATFNALNSAAAEASTEAKVAAANAAATGTDALSFLDLKSSDYLVMVGMFVPLLPAIKASGCRLEIVELKSNIAGVLDYNQGLKALNNCDIAVITATSLITGTCDELINSLNQTRKAIILGPSTPLCPRAFAETRITQLSGSLVINAPAVKQIISESGGTKLLKPYLQFVTQEINGLEK